MNYYNLIFSKSMACRFMRHFIFWLAVFLYHVVRISLIYPSNNISESFISILSGALIWGTICNIIISYTVVYYLIPTFYNHKKWFLFAVGLLLVFAAVFVLALVYNYFMNKQMTHAIYSSKLTPFLFIRGNVIRLLGNPPLICGLLLSLKTIKNWYLKQKENEILVRENTNAELQLLKAQIHPHFLFNTLNNIYSFTLTKSPEAEELVEKLTDTLRYMITDCNVALVPLEKEIKMISNYADLEKVRYGNQLQMHMKIEGDCRNKLIAPLLLIPFVENSFKHGTSKMLEQPWVKMEITIEEDTLLFELINSKPKQNILNSKKGIGLNNVQKRLELLYQKKYFLNIEREEGSFSVKMQLPLQTKNENINLPPKYLLHQ